MINKLTRKNAHTELDHIFKTILPAHGMTERPEQIRLSHTMLDAFPEHTISSLSLRRAWGWTSAPFRVTCTLSSINSRMNAIAEHRLSASGVVDGGKEGIHCER